MITIYIKDFNREVTQDLYDKIIKKLNLNTIKCPQCNHSGFEVHSYYERNIKTRHKIIKITILRVRCQCCGKTHAILLSAIVPYQSIQLKDQTEIINNKDIEDLLDEKPDISEADIYRIKRNYIQNYKQRLISFNLVIDENIVTNCFKYFKRQFLQISRRLNCLIDQIHAD